MTNLKEKIKKSKLINNSLKKVLIEKFDTFDKEKLNKISELLDTEVIMMEELKEKYGEEIFEDIEGQLKDYYQDQTEMIKKYFIDLEIKSKEEDKIEINKLLNTI